jgi:hypothetical protein
MQSVPDRQLQLQLSSLGEQLAGALKAQDWESVGGIDGRIRECLETIAALETVSPELQACKKQLQELYSRVLPAYSEACEKVRQLLLSHVDYAEARSAYLRTDLLQGDK